MPNYIFTKNGFLEKPKNISSTSFDSDAYGTSYNYEPSFTPFNTASFTSSLAFMSEDYKKIKSLKNIINKKSGFDTAFNFDNIVNVSSSVIGINSIYLGNGLEKGTISLNYYYTGSLLAQASDFRENGVLYDLNDNKIGIVLYEHGFIILTSSAALSAETANFIDIGAVEPRWSLFNALSALEANFNTTLSYNCLNTIPTITIFAEAKKGELNHSNNPTFIESGSYKLIANTNNSFVESDKIKIKNTIKSPFSGSNANFEKQTFITKIGVYDKNKNLIAIGSLANPIRKTENREFLFKLQIDI